MLVYKWTIKEEGLFYPLRNYNVDSFDIGKIYPHYKIGHTYNTKCRKRYDTRSRRDNLMNGLSNYIGFHFWKKIMNSWFSKYNHCLKYYNMPTINAILLCNVNMPDIFIENKHQLVACKFEVIKEEQYEKLVYI